LFPIRDLNPTRTTPLGVYLIIALNVFVFIIEINSGVLTHIPTEETYAFFNRFGILPIRYSDPSLSARFTLWEQAFPFLSSIFVHGGFFHLLGNMWMLWIFGDNVEEWLGTVKFLACYLAWGLFAGLIHLAFNFTSTLPTVGASGAIAGVLGAYMLKFPKARVLTLVPIFFFFQFIELPAVVFLGIWFFLQLISGAGGVAGNVAWMAHIGGFVAGAAAYYIFRNEKGSAVG
jgi:membrane associated rhomboid family serine protease